MHNVKATVQGTKLILEIDVSPERLKSAAVSSSGKSRLVASTSGFTGVDGSPVKFGLNVTASL